jgi:S-adenosylmethionine:tRNA ribosyltransferase-isomerase
MRLSDFDFELPPERIALRPATPRDSARLLSVSPSGALADHIVSELPGLLRPGDALVFNDTRVIAARLKGVRDRDGVAAIIHATLHKRLDAARWAAFARPAKRLKVGDWIAFARQQTACDLGARVESLGEGGEVTLAFERAGPDLDLAIAEHGAMPLPPYIAARRPEDEQDLQDYQTIFAREPASVAAPTAGLHFTPELMAALAARGVSAHFLTLEVGAGTFLPVKTQTVADHRMHAERGVISETTAAALNTVRAKGGRLVCVGTTSLRLIESASDEAGTIHPFDGETDIFITPGYRFRGVDGLMTNFHLPKSTLFMLVSALAGLETMKRAYDHAIARGYRFYSYGDASLLWRQS